MSRTESPKPVCQEGLGYPETHAPVVEFTIPQVLGPPLPAEMPLAFAHTELSVELVAVPAQVSFQGISEM
jgi:hypothetical protein